MEFKKISVPSAFGLETNSLFMTFEAVPRRLTVLLPGGFNTYETPLLFYAGRVAVQHGSHILNIEYGYRRAGLSFSPEYFEPSVVEVLASLRLCDIGQYNEISFVSKSFGTVVAGEAARRLAPLAVRHFFLTPVEVTLPYINESACTVVYGTGDPYLTAENAAKIIDSPTIHKIIIPNADHMLEIENDYKASLKILSGICEAYNKFFIKEEE
jgi:hypothetical protein